MNFSQVPSHLRSVLEKMCLDAERRGYERGVLEGRLNGQTEFVSGLKALGVLLPQLAPQQNPVAVMNLSQEIPEPEDDFEIDLDEMVPSAQGDEKTNAFKMLILASVQEAYTARGEDPTELIEALSQILDDPVEVRKWMNGRGDATDLAWKLLKPGMEGYKGRTAKAVWDDPTAGKKPLYGTAAENAFRRQQAFAGEVGDDEVGQARKLLGEDEQAIAVAKGRRAEQIHGQLMQKERFGAEDVQSLEQVLPTLNFRQLGAIRQKLMASLGLDPKKNKEGLKGQGRVEQRIQKLREAIPQLIQAAQKAIASGATEQGGEQPPAKPQIGATGKERQYHLTTTKTLMRGGYSPVEISKLLRVSPEVAAHYIEEVKATQKPKKTQSATAKTQPTPEQKSEPVAQKPAPQVETPVQNEPTVDEQPQPEPESASIDTNEPDLNSDAVAESDVGDDIRDDELAQPSLRASAIVKKGVTPEGRFKSPDDEREIASISNDGLNKMLDSLQVSSKMARSPAESRSLASQYAYVSDELDRRDPTGELSKYHEQAKSEGLVDFIVTRTANGYTASEVVKSLRKRGVNVPSDLIRAVRSKEGIPRPDSPLFGSWRDKYFAENGRGKYAELTTPNKETQTEPAPETVATTPEPTQVVEQTTPQQPQTAVQSDVAESETPEAISSRINELYARLEKMKGTEPEYDAIWDESRALEDKRNAMLTKKRKIVEQKIPEMFERANDNEPESEAKAKARAEATRKAQEQVARSEAAIAAAKAPVVTSATTDKPRRYMVVDDGGENEDITPTEPEATQPEPTTQPKSDYDPTAFSADETNDSYVRDSLFKIAKVPVDKRGESASVLAETAKSVLGQDKFSLAKIAKDNFMTVDELKQSLSRIAQGVDTRKASRQASESAAASLNREMGGNVESGSTSPLTGLPTEPKSRAKSLANRIDRLKKKIRGNITDAKKAELESQIAELESEQKKTVVPEPAPTPPKNPRKPKATPTPATEPEVVTPPTPAPAPEPESFESVSQAREFGWTAVSNTDADEGEENDPMTMKAAKALAKKNPGSMVVPVRPGGNRYVVVQKPSK